jgi:hypothetical protein
MPGLSSDVIAYGVGDVALGTNPVSSEAASVAAVSDTLRQILEAFRLTDVMPHCVLAHGMAATAGRVRAGYRIRVTLFAGLPGPRTILHVVGERPGTGHRAFSVYLTCRDGADWGEAGSTDHQYTRVVAGSRRRRSSRARAPGTCAACSPPTAGPGRLDPRAG